MTECPEVVHPLGSLEAAIEPMWCQHLTHEAKCLLRLTCRTLQMSLDRMVSKLEFHGLQQIEGALSVLERPWSNVRAVELHALGQAAQETAGRALQTLLEARAWAWTHMQLPWSCISSDPGILLRLPSKLHTLSIDGIQGAVDLSLLLNLQDLSSLSLSMAKGQDSAEAVDLVSLIMNEAESNITS